jgi:hypothetical protein
MMPAMARPSLLSAALLAAAVATVACSDDDGLGVPAECNPLGGVGCVTPWPSSAYLREDPASPTGVRLDLAAGSLPLGADRIVTEVAPFNRRTGFSPAAQLFTVFPEGVDDANLAFHDDLAASLAAASPTVILDLATGERVAHFAELDANAAGRPAEQALYLRPAARLAGGRRYAVAIRKSLRRRDGGELAVPPGFQAILDGRRTGHARLEAMRARTEEAIAALEGAGVPRDDLLVAWDFVTADDDSILADPRAVRDAALAAIGEAGANVTYGITRDEAVDADIVRRVLFTYQAPAVADDAGLYRDGAGQPEVRGTSAALGVAMIPACATAERPAGLLIFGHGFFGSLAEAQGGYLRRVARDLCLVVVGGVWRGMSQDDLAGAATALNDNNHVLAFGEKILQGIVDFTALEQLARGALAREVLVDAGGAAIVDPERTYFLGISQGHILGSTFFAWNPHLTRGAFHVGGANWGVLFERSTNWTTFKLILNGAFPSAIDHVVIQQLLQMGFDPTDPVHVAPHVLAGGLPGTPAKQHLLQMSVGDTAVTNLASQLQARTIGLPVLAPALEVPWGLEEGAGPLADAFVIFSEEPTPLPPRTNTPAAQGNVAHDQLRRRDAVVEQLGHFFAEGEVVHTCAGPCNCAQGACGGLDP